MMGSAILAYVFSFLCLLLIVDILEVTAVTNTVQNYLGTRTPYRFKSNKNVSKVKYPDCKAKKIWMVIRHGARLPSARDIAGMGKILKKLKQDILFQHNQGKGELSREQLKKIHKWSPELDELEEKYLTLEGQIEMSQLAERMQSRFPDAIENKYNNKTFLFRYTATQRTQQSAIYFTLGLFEKKDAQNVMFAPATKIDPLLRFYKHCDKWQKQVKKNPKTYEEQRLFGISREMNETLKSVSKRLGLSNFLSLDAVCLMYKMCGYETSWHKHHSSPWCDAFTPETAEVLEYYYDLKHYWLDGYGHNLTHRQACLPIKHMFENFRNENSPSSIFLFAHSGTLLKILSHLQLYKPEKHLRGNAINRKRDWKASNIDCFAANLAFVLFNCKDGDHVLTLHQERIIKLPMCKEELCPLKHLLHHFNHSINDCVYSDICRLPDND